MFDGISKPIVVAATSDIHGHLEGILEVCNSSEVDILVLAGDIEPADPFVSKPYWFERKFFNLVSKLDCEVVAIPGNHDFYLASKYDAIKRDRSYHVPTNFHLLVDEEISLEGIRFYGTPWVPTINGRWCFECDDDDLGDRFSMIPANVDVLITHTPPFLKDCGLDQSFDYPQEYRRHFGSKSLAHALFSKCPTIVFCGHIHSGQHECTLLGTPRKDSAAHIWNVSRVNESYNIAYKIRVIKISKGSVQEVDNKAEELLKE